MISNKDKILQIALKYNGQKRINVLIEFREVLEVQRDLVKAQIKATQKIINYEIVQLRKEEDNKK